MLTDHLLVMAGDGYGFAAVGDDLVSLISSVDHDGEHIHTSVDVNTSNLPKQNMCVYGSSKHTSMVHASLLSACLRRVCSYQSMHFVRHMICCPISLYIYVYVCTSLYVRVDACLCVLVYMCRYIFMCMSVHARMVCMSKCMSTSVSFCVCSNWAYISINISMGPYI